jgi:uncharacterized protein YjaG (DUF416 family)
MPTAKATRRVRTPRAMGTAMRVTKLQQWQTVTKIACECTTQQPTKAMEITRAAMTRTAKARVKARSTVH